MKTLNELSAQATYSLEDIKLFVNHYKLRWKDDWGVYYKNGFVLVVEPYPELSAGTEILGTYSGYQFVSRDKKIKVELTDGIRGIVDCLLFVCNDGNQVIFY